MAFRGVDVRETGDRLVFRALLQDSDGALLATGTTTLKLYELQNDGTLYSYDFNDNTFKSGALTTETQAMTHRTGDNNTTNTGLWTWALTTLTDFTAGNIYFAMVNNTGAFPVDQQREFQFGSGVLADVVAISGDATAADNLELQYDTTGLAGDTFPANQSQLSNIANTGSATNTVATSDSTVSTGSADSGTYASTIPLDGTRWVLNDAAGTLDMYFEFNVGNTGVPVSVTWTGYLRGSNDSLDVYGYDWVGSAWVQIGTVDGKNQATNDPARTFTLFNTMVGTGANDGIVRVQFQNTGLSSAVFATDQIYCSFSTERSATGYANGRIWVDTVGGTSGAVEGVNGVADLAVDNWADALTLNALLGFNRFNIAGGSTITLSANSDGYDFAGTAWNLALDSQSIDNISVEGAKVTGAGTASAANRPHFSNCEFGAVTLPPSIISACGIGESSGLFTGGSAGQYIFHNCYSVVAGSGVPSLKFDGLGSATGINVRGWNGGSSWTLDSDCTVSHEVIVGGGQTFVTGGASVELRGVFRAATFTLSGAGTVQIVGVMGPVTLSGTATTTVNLYGVSSSLTDTSVNTTVNDLMGRSNTTQISGTAQTANDNGADLNTLITQVGTAGDGLTNINLPNQTMDITGNLSGSVGSVTAAVTTDAASRTASKADVSALATEANVTAVGANVTAILEDTGTTIPASLALLATAAALTSAATDITIIRILRQNRLEISITDSKAYIWNDAGDAREYETALTNNAGGVVTTSTEGPINAAKWTAI